MAGIILLLLVFADIGFAFYLIVKEGLCKQLSQIEKKYKHA